MERVSRAGSVNSSYMKNAQSRDELLSTVGSRIQSSLPRVGSVTCALPSLQHPLQGVDFGNSHALLPFQSMLQELGE